MSGCVALDHTSGLRKYIKKVNQLNVADTKQGEQKNKQASKSKIKQHKNKQLHQFKRVEFKVIADLNAHKMVPTAAPKLLIALVQPIDRETSEEKINKNPAVAAPHTAEMNAISHDIPEHD